MAIERHHVDMHGTEPQLPEPVWATAHNGLNGVVLTMSPELAVSLAAAIAHSRIGSEGTLAEITKALAAPAPGPSMHPDTIPTVTRAQFLRGRWNIIDDRQVGAEPARAVPYERPRAVPAASPAELGPEQLIVAEAEEIVRMAVEAAALKAADAAAEAREVRAVATSSAAVTAAHAASEAAAAMLRITDLSASRVAFAAALAASTVAATVKPGTEADAALRARHLSRTVAAAADATAADAAQAAVEIAAAVAAAAERVASIASTAEVAIEQEVSSTAAELHELALAASRRLRAEAV